MITSTSIGLLGIIFLACIIAIFITIKEFELEELERARIKARLLGELKGVAEYFKIPITYHENLGVSAGQFHYGRGTSSGEYYFNNREIRIKTEYKEHPDLLAHELGHFISLILYNDSSESSADYQALKLCKQILTEDEQKKLEIFLKTHFEDNINTDQK